jgi:hypothetical protein
MQFDIGALLEKRQDSFFVCALCGLKEPFVECVCVHFAGMACFRLFFYCSKWSE